MREDYIFADREVVGSYGLRAQSEREPPLGAAILSPISPLMSRSNDRYALAD
jgi:hypothetical protein